jgi:hypothetical protein
MADSTNVTQLFSDPGDQHKGNGTKNAGSNGRRYSYRESKACGTTTEIRTFDYLQTRTWETGWNGIERFPEGLRYQISTSGSIYRYMPEIFASKPGRPCMIDCKARMEDTGFYSINVATLKAHQKMVAMFEIPIYYVFDNMGVLPRHIAESFLWTRGSTHREYVLIPQTATRAFDAYFGSPVGDVPFAA